VIFHPDMDLDHLVEVDSSGALLHHPSPFSILQSRKELHAQPTQAQERSCPPPVLQKSLATVLQICLFFSIYCL
jgi:hypothetical protein